MKPLHLSQAHVTEAEREAVIRALSSGWVAPVGPEVDGFEQDFEVFTGARFALALSSGTAGLHLGLLGLGVRRDDLVVIPTLTFAATAFAVTYVGAQPVLLDVEQQSFGLDAVILSEFLEEHYRAGGRVAAVVPVDLVGRPADYDRLLAVTAEYDIPMLIDAAESLGATYRGRPAGTFGQAGVFSFNGNKIMTTSGGGMLVSDDEALMENARRWSAQSRQPVPWYEHEEIGFNYRMSNILAALGRAQLVRLPDMIKRRRAIHSLYRDLLSGIEGLEVTEDPEWGRGNSWLTTITLDREILPGMATFIREHLHEQQIETRPFWKPMHAQPVFRNVMTRLTGVADRLFEEGLCLPSGVGLTDDDVARVAEGIRQVLEANPST